MYNGIGLSTARGSGTNGYVVKNLAHVRAKAPGSSVGPGALHHPKGYLQDLDEVDSTSRAQRTRRTSPQVYAHLSKRDIEKQLFAFEEGLRQSADAISEDEIVTLVAAERTRLLALYDARQQVLIEEKSRQIDRQKVQQEQCRAAFHIANDVQEGKAFRFEEIAHNKEERRHRANLPNLISNEENLELEPLNHRHATNKNNILSDSLQSEKQHTKEQAKISAAESDKLGRGRSRSRSLENKFSPKHSLHIRKSQDIQLPTLRDRSPSSHNDRNTTLRRHHSRSPPIPRFRSPRRHSPMRHSYTRLSPTRATISYRERSRSPSRHSRSPKRYSRHPRSPRRHSRSFRSYSRSASRSASRNRRSRR
jgi:serine/arginine repetitive matrix protein 2